MLEIELINQTIDRAAHTVLVVDDNPATLYSTARVLRAAGFKTREGTSGMEAIEASQEGVSAIVLDVHLPDFDGFEVCRRIRARPATANLPVVHLSAQYVREEDRVAGLNAGADSYIVHPVEPPVLVGTVQALIRARTAEDEVRRSEQRFRAIYDQAQSCIALIDASGNIVEANPAFAAVVGMRAQELFGKPLEQFAPREAAAEVKRLIAGGTQDGQHAARGTFPLLDAHGRDIHYQWSVSTPLEGLRIAVGVDVSERHELEARRRELLERETSARAAAERHSRTKDDFIAVLSHELRTPLSSIVGWLHILRRRGTTPEATKGLDAIDRSVQMQVRIISDILDVSRINSGKLRLERSVVDPAELIATSIASLREPIEEKKLAVESDIESAHAPAFLDPDRFQQIFLNLMTNAIKFSPVAAPVHVTLRREGEMLKLRVQDFGKGMEADFLPLLFDRFSQSDSPENRRHGGLGLGLSIVKHLVDLHGGRVAARSAGLGQGTTMEVELPVGPQDAATAAPADSTAGNAPPVVVPDGLEGVRLLLVEDDMEAREMLSIVLKERGAELAVAPDHDTALALLSTFEPSVVVSDIGLPGRDGYEIVRAIRQQERETGAPRRPVIALTAFGRSEDKLKSLEAGFDMHLGKPIRPHDLLAAIASVLKKK